MTDHNHKELESSPNPRARQAATLEHFKLASPFATRDVARPEIVAESMTRLGLVPTARETTQVEFNLVESAGHAERTLCSMEMRRDDNGTYTLYVNPRDEPFHILITEIDDDGDEIGYVYP